MTFENGATKDYDVIIKATGYLHNFPFMADELKLATTNRFVPDDLYNQMILINLPIQMVWGKLGVRMLILGM